MDQRQRGHDQSLEKKEGEVVIHRTEKKGGVTVAFSSMSAMSISKYSSSAPWSFTSEPELFGDEEHDVWNSLLVIIAHHMFSDVLQRSPREEDLCKVAVSCHFALDLLTVGNVQVARLRRWIGDRLAGNRHM